MPIFRPQDLDCQFLQASNWLSCLEIPKPGAMPSPAENRMELGYRAVAGVGMFGAAAPSMPTPADAIKSNRRKLARGEGMAPGRPLMRVQFTNAWRERGAFCRSENQVN